MQPGALRVVWSPILAPLAVGWVNPRPPCKQLSQAWDQSLPLSSDLISQGLLKSGVVRGLEQNGQVTRKWPSSPLSYSSLPVVPPLADISLTITNKQI